MNSKVVASQIPGWVVTWLSEERLAPYIAASGSASPLDLYKWNSQLSSAFFELLGWFEVAWRNTIDTAVVQRGGVSVPSPGQIIAELPLGFWRFTTKGYRNTIWAPYLKKAFPSAHPRPRHQDLDTRLRAIIRERNRVAHHEPLFRHPAELQRRVQDILKIGHRINPQAAQWWQENTAIDRVIAARSGL